MSREFVLLLMLLCGLDVVASNEEEKEWMLMARHGECVEIQSLARKFPQMDKISTPDEFIKTMSQRGYSVKDNLLPDSNGQVIQVDVDEENITLLFVDVVLCQKRND